MTEAMTNDQILCGITSREAAQAKGVIKYFTGEACSKGHVSERYTRNAQCVECARAHVKKCADGRKHLKAEYDKARSETYKARKTELSKKRYAEKKDEYAKHWANYYAENKESLNKKNKVWREANRERLEQYRIENSDRIYQYRARHYKENYDYYLIRNRARRAAERSAEGTHSKKDIELLERKQKGRCAFCVKPISSGYHVDHIVPLALGGGNGPENLQLLCPTCNLKKGAKDPIEWRRQNGMLL